MGRFSSNWFERERTPHFMLEGKAQIEWSKVNLSPEMLSVDLGLWTSKRRVRLPLVAQRAPLHPGQVTQSRREGSRDAQRSSILRPLDPMSQSLTAFFVSYMGSATLTFKCPTSKVCDEGLTTTSFDDLILFSLSLITSFSFLPNCSGNSVFGRILEPLNSCQQSHEPLFLKVRHGRKWWLAVPYSMRIGSPAPLLFRSCLWELKIEIRYCNQYKYLCSFFFSMLLHWPSKHWTETTQ